MGSSSRSLALAALFALLVPQVASAQGTGVLPVPPPPGGGAAPAGGPSDPGGAGAAGAAADKKPASAGNVGGVSFQDKPAQRSSPVARAVIRRSGPLATFPGFEQLPDGGTRFFVQLNQSVPVEERRAQGSITYVLKSAHLRVHNDANSLVTVHFNTPVFRARLVPSGNDLLFILELRAAATPTFKLTDNQDRSATLQIDFPKGDFINGDGNESLPSETRPAPGQGRGKGKGRRGQGGTTPPAQAPDPQAPAGGDPGPNP